MSEQQPNRGQWGSRVGFILAAAGSAIGLGNIWKFPYITGENGGGLFVLIYLVCIALVGLPIMMAEIMIGRAAQKQPVVAFEKLQGKRTGWTAVGWLGVMAGFVILSYYIVVAGWAMDFTLKSVTNFTGAIHDDAETAGIEYRASKTMDEMRALLTKRDAERAWKDPVAEIKQIEAPSVWDTYEFYVEGLAAVGVEDPVQLDAERTVWQGYEAVYLESKGLPIPDPAKILSSKKFKEASARLLEKRKFGEKVPLAQKHFVAIEEAKRDEWQKARDYWAGVSDEEVRDEAEADIRRGVIFDKVDKAFGDVASDGWTSAFWAALFMLMTILVVANGVGQGIEKTCKILMPMLFGLILVMVFYGATTTGFGEAASFVFKPDPNKLKASGVLEALGHAFFTLSLGMGAMITYGSYQKTRDNLASQAVVIAVLDTAIALLACLMMFPILFTYGQEPAAGPGLVFKSMPLAFAEIGSGGILLAILFFGLVVFAALTSSISLLEVVASYFIDKRGWSRVRAAWVFGGVIFVFGWPSAFAMDPDFALSGWKTSFGSNFFDVMDYLASNWMLPLGGLFIALYAGWAMPKRLRNAELEGLGALVISGWLFLIRFVAPILVVLVLAQKVGLINADEVFHQLFGG